MAFVEDACDQCGRVAPRNELTEISRKVVTGGTSSSYRTYARGGMGFTSGRTDYRIERLRLCPPCYSSWLAAIEARRRAVWLGVSLVILLALLAAVAFAIFGRTSTDDQKSVNSVAMTPSNVTAENIVAEAQPNPASSTDAVTDAENAQDSPAPAEAADTKTTVPVVVPTPENTPALSKAVADALDSGSSKPWAADGRSGEVTVGEERFYQGRPCKSFAYTVGSTTMPLAYACAGVDGIWRPDHSFAPPQDTQPALY